MSSYTQVDLNPTEGQLMDLSEGNTVKLAPANMKGDVTFHLTKTQLARVQAAQAAGKGTTLKFSKAQIKHMGQHGAGKFSEMVKAGLNVLKPVLQAGAKSVVDIGKNYAEKGAAQLLEKGADFVKSKIGGSITAKDIAVLRSIEKKHGRGFFGSLLGSLFGGSVGGIVGIDPLWSTITPTQWAHIQGMHKRLGGSLFGDILKNIAHGGVNFVADRFGGAMKPSTVCRPRYQPTQEEIDAVVAQHGEGFFADALKQLAHGTIDFAANKLGGEINPLLNGGNEDLRRAIYQKKVEPMGQGLRV